MKPLNAIALLVFVLGLTTGIPSVCWSQQPSPAPAVQPDSSGALTEEEERAFAARLRAAPTNDIRAKIERERADLIQVRIIQRGVVQIIPPSPSELAEDPIMPDVPTPPLDRSRPSGTLPGGALAPDIDPGLGPALPGLEPPP